MDRVRNVTREYRASQWAGHIKECRNSGQTIRSWCAEHGVNEKSFYYWQRRFREGACLALEHSEAAKLPAFAEISMGKAEEAKSSAATIRVGEITAEIHNQADPGTIETVLRTLKTLC